jgi:hypothetical protein
MKFWSIVIALSTFAVAEEHARCRCFPIGYNNKSLCESLRFIHECAGQFGRCEWGPQSNSLCLMDAARFGPEPPSIAAEPKLTANNIGNLLPPPA